MRRLSRCSAWRACHTLCEICIFSQISAPLPKNSPSCTAIFGVTGRSAARMRCRFRREVPSRRAISLTLSPASGNTISRNKVPGCVGSRFRSGRFVKLALPQKKRCAWLLAGKGLARPSAPVNSAHRWLSRHLCAILRRRNRGGEPTALVQQSCWSETAFPKLEAK